MATLRRRIIDWLGNVVSDTSPTPAETQVVDDLMACQWMEVARAVMAGYVIAAIQRSQVVFHVGGVRSYGQDAWLWNVSPNPNQSRSAFIGKLLTQLLGEEEGALVVPVRRRGSTSLYVADSFARVPHPGLRDTFESIVIEGSSEVMRRKLTSDEVYYFNLGGDSGWTRLMAALDAQYDQLGSSVAHALVDSNARRFVLRLDQEINGTEEQRRAIEGYIKGNLRSFIRSSSAVLPIYRGMELERMGAERPSSASANSAAAQAVSIRRDMFATVASCFRIPAAFLDGNTNNFEQLLESFLTFAVDPIACATIAEEISRKTYTQQQWERGGGRTCVTVDTTHVRHVDLFAVADKVAKLVGSSVDSPNEIRRFTGQEPIPEPWADEYQRTKNNDMAGGGENNA